MHNQTLEFNVLKNYNRTNGNNKASAKVIINSAPKDISYPTTETEIVDESIPATNYVGGNGVAIVPPANHIDNYIPSAFYEKLAYIMSEILATNNSTLFVNVIDKSGFIILKAEELIKLISILTAASSDNISIHYASEEETGCCITKYTPVKTIQSITVNNQDLQFSYNKQYNILKNQFRLSLNRCFIWDV